MTPAMRVVVLASGRGSNLGALIGARREPDARFEIVLVAGDKPDALALRIAEAAGIATLALDPRGYANRASYDADLFARIAEHAPDLVVLAGFMRILTPHFIGAFAGRILNVHPALLPNYRGLHTHRRVLEAGETLHGVSVHFVTEELDGGPVILQAEVPVMPGDSETTLSARVQRAEHRIYPQVIEWFAHGRLLLKDGRARLDGRPLEMPLREPAEGPGG